MGALGAFFVQLNMQIVALRKRFHRFEKSLYSTPFFIMIITGIITCPSVIGPYMSLLPRQ